MEKSNGDSRIREKIWEAYKLFILWGEDLRKDPQIGSLLKSLAKKIAASARAMEDFGVSEACRHCHEKDGSTCCGAGIEERYTSGLLLINLLYGNTLPTKRFRESGCFFLSENGCGLKTRLILCVNYLCLRIQKLQSVKELARLQKITGEEMEASFILEEAVKKFIKGKSYGP